MDDYSFADGWYADKSMRKNYKSHVIDWYGYLEDNEDNANQLSNKLMNFIDVDTCNHNSNSNPVDQGE